MGHRQMGDQQPRDRHVADRRHGVLTIRQLALSDEGAFASAHEALHAAGYHFGFGYDSSVVWADYVTQLNGCSLGIGLAADQVPATFLVAVIDGKFVGRVSIRHELNDFLATLGGHIGYAVLPRHRRQGYATELLRHGLIVAAAHGIERALVTCDEDNVGSRVVIERCGGVYESSMEVEGDVAKRRYWISTG